MPCKDIKHLIIDSSEKQLQPQEMNTIQEHIKRCSTCARFQDDLEKIRTGLRTSLSPTPSDELWEKTRARCVKEMQTRDMSPNRKAIKLPGDSPPKIIWIALLSLIILTVLVMIHILKDFNWDGTLSFPAAVVLTLILQNTAMLIFSPILLRRCRGEKSGFRRMSFT